MFVYHFTMRKMYILPGILFFFVSNFIHAFSPISIFPDYEYPGFKCDFVIDYGQTFDNELPIMNFKITASVGNSGHFSSNFGLSSTFSWDVNIFDIYLLWGGSFYPFKKFFSISFDMGIGGSYILFLNHFPYIISIRGNFDIPIYKEHHITIGAGLQHRNSIKIFNYLQFKDTYFGIYNSYFFEIGYRIFIN